MSSQEIARLDPEIRYLVTLTRAGLKPLSRWEAGLDEDARRAIRRQGLHVDTIERRTRFGRRLHETVFAKRSGYIDLYHKHYHRTRLRDKPADARLQGRLFGYPSCCVEAFAERPYTPNDLDPRDQKILFHWACPSCNTTPGLAREYRRAAAIWGDNIVHLAQSPNVRRPSSSSVLSKVAATLALTAGTAALAAPTQNPHQVLTQDDADKDGFSVAEEILMGTNWHIPDTDGDQTEDGVQSADLLLQIINNPPPWITVHDHAQLGLTYCQVCGQSINMGYVTVENTFTGRSMDVYYIGLHAMENGCTSYWHRLDGTIADQYGQVDLFELESVLRCGLNATHQLIVRAGDGDGDSWTDAEEDSLGMNGANSLDGRALTEELLGIIAHLPREAVDSRPYLLEHEMDGVEQCEICGENFNMGSVEIVSPRDGLSISMPYVGLHMIAHGCFAYNGTVNDGEVLPLALHTVLLANGSAHWVELTGDADDDGLLDSEEAFFGLDSGIADEDNSGKPDGRELALRMAAQISSLPEGPLPGETYVVHNMTHGAYDCLICGETINMGYMEVVDPVAGKSVNVPYYTHHFMEKGSFSTDRDDLYPRVDPTLVGEVTGITSITGIGDGTPKAPFSFVNAPNPFDPAVGTQITVDLPSSGEVTLTIYDVEGRLVRKLFDGKAQDRELSLRWDGTDDRGVTVGAGVYFCRAKFGQVVVSRKMTLVR